MTRQAEALRNAGAEGECVCGEVRLEEYVDRMTEELHLRVEHQRRIFFS